MMKDHETIGENETWAFYLNSQGLFPFLSEHRHSGIDCMDRMGTE